MTKIVRTTPAASDIFSQIQKIEPKQGDVLLFHVKTDDDGIPFCDIDTIHQTAEMLQKVLEPKKAIGFIMLDKICLFSVEDYQSAIKSLENSISIIQESKSALQELKNRKGRFPAVVNLRQNEDGKI